MKARFAPIILFMLLALLVSSCTAGGDEELSFEEIDTTYAVQTIAIRLSQTVETPTSAVATADSSADVTPLSTSSTLSPVSNGTFTAPSPNQLLPTATATEPSCDLAAFVQHVTVPVGTSIYAGDQFIKTWRLRNIGSCTWTTAYDLVFVEGDQLAAVDEVPLPGTVSPFQEVEIVVPMMAPEELGRYRGGWKLRNQDGRIFDLVDDSQIVLDIQVIAPQTARLIYSFSDTVCNAFWSSSASVINQLPCPGALDQTEGFVYLRDHPVVEDARTTTVLGIETHPTWQSNPAWNAAENGGWIKGLYPPVRIEPGSHFLAQLGCLDNASTCDVNFSLQAQIQGLPLQELGFWHQVYDNVLEPVDIDLVNYTGLDLVFVLIVDANNNAGLDQAIWLNPRIER